MKKLIWTFVLGLSISLNVASAQQKIGHINSAELLDLMPESALADTQLVKFRDSVMIFADSIGKVFGEKVKNFEAEAQAGKIPPVELERIKTQLEKEQVGLQRYEQQIEQALGIRRQQLLAPILQKVDKAIKEVAAEGKYDYIIDVSQGSLLFAADSVDLMATMKTKLGLK